MTLMKKNFTSNADELPDHLRYSIHLNSFRKQEAARLRVQELKNLRYNAFMIPGNIPRKGLFHRVFTGNFTDFESAGKACLELKGKKEFRKDIHVVDRKWMTAK